MANNGLTKKDSGCWDAKTDIGSGSEDEVQITINLSPGGPHNNNHSHLNLMTTDSSSTDPIIIPNNNNNNNDYLIEPYEMDIENPTNEINYTKADKDKGGSIGGGTGGIFMTSQSGKPVPDIENFHERYIRKNSLANSIIGGNNLGASGEKGSCKSVSSIMIPPSSLGSAESRSSLISGGGKGGHGLPGLNPEPWYHIIRDITIPFFIAGLGMVGAGLLLDYVMHWDVFTDLPELVVLVTPFLGLKGNLEMTLASRLSTQANIGNMNDKREKRRICFGNLALDQLQAIVCGLVASFFALGMNFFKTGEWPLDHVLLLTASSIITASMVSVVLGSIMVAVILASRRYKVNPDNIATPVAGSLGDVVTLYMLSTFSSFIWTYVKEGDYWIAYVIYGVYAVIVPICFVIVYRNEYVKKVLITGWLPVIISVVISTGAGIILDIAGGQYHDLALYQPLINGIGGNLVSVQASRIATHMHATCVRKILPNNGRICQAPWSFITKGAHAISARVLLFLTLPGHTFFVTIAWLIRLYPEGRAYDFVFLAIFLLAALVQVSILLYFAQVLSNFMWRHGQDPDVSTIPFLTACGDLIGTGVLFIAFFVHESIV